MFQLRGTFIRIDSTELRDYLLGNLKKLYNIDNSVLNFDFTTVDHDLDSLLCCLAGIDFIEGRCKQTDIPQNVLEIEGLIWAK